MNVHYRLPRLAPIAAGEIRRSLSTQTEFSESDFLHALAEPNVFPGTGGRPIPSDLLLSLRKSVLDAVGGTPDEIESHPTSHVDLLIGRALFEFGKDCVGELGNPRVWDFLTLALLPDIAVRRYSPTGSSSASRFTGGNRRHLFQRLWKRWLVLGPKVVESNFLTEDDYVALLERRLTSERPIVARYVARSIHSSGLTGSRRRDYTRVLIRRVQAMSGIVVISDDDRENLDAVFKELERQSSELMKAPTDR